MNMPSSTPTSVKSTSAITTMTIIMSSNNGSIDSPAGTCNAFPVFSAQPLPICPPSNYRPISLRSAESALITGNVDVDEAILRGLVHSLIQTCKNRENTNRGVQDCLADQVRRLSNEVREYQKVYEDALEGYMENNKFLLLKVPIGAGFYLPAKWIKCLNNSEVATFSTHDGPRDSPHIVPIYAAPTHSTDEPIKALPCWFQSIVYGSHPQFLAMVVSARQLDNWGVAADIARLRNFNKEISAIDIQISHLHKAHAGKRNDKQLCEQCLEASCCAKQLACWEGLAPHTNRAKWATHFTNDHLEDDFKIDGSTMPIRNQQARRGRRF
jgi:hypothetical protein